MKKPNWYHGNLFYLPNTDKRKKKYRKQLRDKGYDNTEFWNLDVTLSSLILVRLKAFREYDKDYIVRDEEYNQKLDKTIKAFELILEEQKGKFDYNQQVANDILIQEGLHAFADIFRHLWT